MRAHHRIWTLVSTLLVIGLATGCDRQPTSPTPSSDDAWSGTVAPARATVSHLDGVTRYDGVTGGDNVYAFLVPDDWGGDLVLYAHGFIDSESPLELPTNDNIEAVRDRLVSEGFAFAYCSYRENGLAVKEGAWATHHIAQLFHATVREPDRTWLVGHSLGGLIAVELAEKHPQFYDGVLTLAGMIGGSAQQLDYVANVRILFDFFYPGVLPGSVLEVPEGMTVQDVIDLAVPAVMANPTGAFVIGQLLCVPAPTDEALVQSIITALAFNVRGIGDVLERTHGQCPIDNLDTVYHTDNPMVPAELLQAINAFIPRYDRTDHADAVLRQHYEPVCELEIPMIAVHREWDPTVPKCGALKYEECLEANGYGDMFELRTVYEYGHSVFSEDLVSDALADLIAWAGTSSRLAVY